MLLYNVEGLHFESAEEAVTALVRMVELEDCFLELLNTFNNVVLFGTAYKQGDLLKKVNYVKFKLIYDSWLSTSLQKLHAEMEKMQVGDALEFYGHNIEVVEILYACNNCGKKHDTPDKRENCGCVCENVLC